MGIKTRLARWLLKAARGTSGITFVPEWLTTSFFQPTFQAILQEGYKRNSVVWACVEALAFAFPEPPLLAWRTANKSEPVADHEHTLSRLLARPNPNMGYAQLAQFAIVYCALGGNCYLWRARNSLGQTVQLWPFHDGHITPLPGHRVTEGLVRAYSYSVGDGRTIEIPPEDIIHWRWMPDPQQPYRGLGPVGSIAREIDTDNEATRYVFALLKNDAMPRVVVTLVEGDELTPEKHERLRRQWKARYGGEHTGEPGFLEAGMKVQRLGMSLAELAFESLSAVPEARIAAAFRTPPIVAGLNVGLARATYSNYAEALTHWTEQTLVPLWNSFADTIGAAFRDEYPDIIIDHDLSDVRALSENEKEKWDRLGMALDRGAITRAEYRSALGLPVGPADDVYKESLTMVWTPRERRRTPVEPTEDEDQAPKMLPSDGRERQPVES